MPAAVAGFVAWLGASTAAAFGVTLASFTVSLAVGSAVIALTVASVRRVRNLREPGEIGQLPPTSTISVASTEAPANIAYGDVLIGGVVTYVNTTQFINNIPMTLYIEVVHTGHEVPGVEGFV